MPESLASRLKRKARRLGLSDIGITPAAPSDHGTFLARWLEAGMAGEMSYLGRDEAMARRMDPTLNLEGARSVVVVADHYPPDDPPGVPGDPSVGVIARYARGRDYHNVLAGKLKALARWLDEAVAPEEGGGSGTGAEGGSRRDRHRSWVDTGPLLERELGRRAGLGWFGRNTMLIHPRRGSYFFLGVLLTTVELDPDPPFEADRCGSCTACLDACPTGALLGRDEDGAPVLDARLCISYLTIEQKGSIPEELRPRMGNRVFGCDICQEVCPWNERFAAGQEVDPAHEARPWPPDREGDPSLPSLDGPDLLEFTERILAMSGKEYRRVFADSALSRPGRKGMLRNLCVALGNYGRTSDDAARRVRPVLEGAAEDRSDLVREHAVWGLRECGGAQVDD
jgi:epoxyqueuosine reductase